MAKAKKGSLLGRINPVSLGSTADASFMIEKVDEKDNDDFNLSYVNSTIDYFHSQSTIGRWLHPNPL